MSGFFRLLLLLALLVSGCGRRPSAPPAAVLSETVVWGDAPATLALIESAHSPALLVQSGPGPLRLFAGRAPGWLAWSAAVGQRVTNAPTRLAGTNLTEGWLLVWWAGAAGWADGDSAVALLLGRRPAEVVLDGDGLTLSLPAGSGPLVVLPLFGAQRLPGPGQELAATPGRKDPWPGPWRWTNGLPREPLTRLRYWLSASRHVPLGVENRTEGAALSESFVFHTLPAADWPALPLKLVPVRPAVAAALLPGGGGPVVEITPRAFNHELPVAGGPFFGAQNADGYTARWPAGQAPATAWPTHGLALTVGSEPGRWPELRLVEHGGPAITLGEVRPGTKAVPAAVDRVAVTPTAWRVEARQR